MRVRWRIIVGCTVIAIVGAVVIEVTSPSSYRDDVVGYLEAARRGDGTAAVAHVCATSREYVAGTAWSSDLADLAGSSGELRGYSIRRGGDDVAVFDVLLGEHRHATSLEVERLDGEPCLLIPPGHPLGFVV